MTTPEPRALDAEELTELKPFIFEAELVLSEHQSRHMMVMQVARMKAVSANQKATISRLEAQCAVLLQMAEGFDADNRDYERVNNLAGCENNHWRTQLRNFKANPDLAAAALLDRVRRARTPGTVEVCEKCGRTKDTWTLWCDQDCPIAAKGV